MIVYQTNLQGIYIGPVMADESPLEPGVWLIPGGCVEVEPPAIPSGMLAVWEGDQWSLRVAESADPVTSETPAPPAVPVEVSRFQARAGLIVYGEQIGRPNLIDEADAVVAALSAGQFGLTSVQVRVIKEAWANALVIRRDSPALNMIFPALGLKLPEQLDALFIVAAQQVA